MGMKLVAEGVENKFILEALKNIGVHNFQGYLFHIPEPMQSVCERDAAEAAAASTSTPQLPAALRSA
jgi:EAL domain-containing protein (putative c-di-GMP-specific phosphodiesterase class I)